MTFPSLDGRQPLMQGVARRETRLAALAVLTLLVCGLVPAASYLHGHGAGEHGYDGCDECSQVRQLFIDETTPPSLLSPTPVAHALIADPCAAESCFACSLQPTRGPPA